MVESGAFEVSEENVVEALEFGHEQVKKIVRGIKELHAQIKPTKVVVEPLPFDKAIYDTLKKTYGAKLLDALNTEKHPKKESYHLVDALLEEILKPIPEDDEEKQTLTKRAFERLREEIFRDEVLEAAGVPMAAPSTRFARSPAKSASCRASTAPRSSPAAKPRRSPLHPGHQGRYAAPRVAL